MEVEKIIKTFNDVSNLDKLGSGSTKYIYDEPISTILETFDNTAVGRDYLIELKLPEFTSHCVIGSTLIDTTRNETENNQGVPIKELVGTEGYVYSFEHTTNEPVVRRYYNVRKTREKTQTLKVTFKKMKRNDDCSFTYINENIIVTPDHPILVQRGFKLFEWVLAKDLKYNDKLVADQRLDDYMRGRPRHRLIAECLLGRRLTYNEVAHHIDFNHLNNDIDNIEVLSTSEHLSIHQKDRYGWDTVLDVDALVLEYNSGENFHSLAKKYNCDVSTIYARIEHLVVKRTQSESLALKPESLAKKQIFKECADYYSQGYTIYELASYYNIHSTTILSWIKQAGGVLRTANDTRYLRQKIELPALNHRIVSIEDGPIEDVYNMEVEDTECYFANGIVVHNCPKTNQPDFANFYIRYIPDLTCIESKSIKLYMGAYRNFGCFMESTVNKIIDDWVSACNPKWVEVHGIFAPRGGITLNVYSEYVKDGFIVPFDYRKTKSGQFNSNYNI